MNRRHFLGAGVGAFSGLSGCVVGYSPATGGPPPAPPRPTGRPAELPVPDAALVRAAPRDGIPAIVAPVFGTDWAGVTVEGTTRLRGTYTSEPRLRTSDRVVGVERGGEARAYPLKLLNWHEAVNDQFDGPLLVTYCPLCGSAMVAERRVAGQETTFGVSGLLHRDDLVLYDSATESLWEQISATAIQGPRTGETLTLVPSTFTTLGEWREAHPETLVLRPPPESGTVRGPVTFPYGLDRYGAYRASRGVGPNEAPPRDERLHPKTRVVGVVADGEARAYPYPAVESAGLVEDWVGERPVVVAVGPARSVSALSGSLFAYDRRIGARTLSFSATDERGVLRADGSRWDVTTGRALDGPFRGRRIRQANAVPPLFWFAWVERHPETEIYRVDDRR